MNFVFQVQKYQLLHDARYEIVTDGRVRIFLS